jgi:hypothetical protein
VEQCARLNEINSGPLREQTHVVHYKGGWQRILLDGRPFSSVSATGEVLGDARVLFGNLP